RAAMHQRKYKLDGTASRCHNRVMIRVTLEPAAAEQLLKLPTRIKDRVTKILARLEKWPDVSGAKPLRHGLAGHYRMRTGDYRIQFHIAENEAIVERIGHRDGFYED